MPTPDPKPTRQTDEDYLDHIKEQYTCLVCPRQPDPHHLDSRGSGGSDYTVVPLCRRHHSELHGMTNAEFEEKYRLNLWKCALRALRRYIADRPIMK